MTMKTLVLIVAATMAVASTGADAQSQCLAAADCAACVVMPDCYYMPDGKCVDDTAVINSCDEMPMKNSARFGTPALPAADICVVLKDRQTAALEKIAAATACGEFKDCATCVPAGSTSNCVYQTYAQQGMSSSCALDPTSYQQAIVKAGKAVDGMTCDTSTDCATGLECKQPPMPPSIPGINQPGPAVMPPMICMDKLAMFRLANPDNFTPPDVVVPGGIPDVDIPDVDIPSGVPSLPLVNGARRRLLCDPMQMPDPDAFVKTVEQCVDVDTPGVVDCQNLSCEKCLQQDACSLQMSDGKCVSEVTADTCYGPPQAINKDRYPEGFKSDAEAAPACKAIDAVRQYEANMAVVSAECARLKFCDSCLQAAFCTFAAYDADTQMGSMCMLDAAAYNKANPAPPAAGVAPVPPMVNCPEAPAVVPPMPAVSVKDDEACPTTGLGAEKDPVAYKDQTEEPVVKGGGGGGEVDNGGNSGLSPAFVVSAAMATMLALMF